MAIKVNELKGANSFRGMRKICCKLDEKIGKQEKITFYEAE